MPQTNKIHTKIKPKRTCLLLFRLKAVLFALLIFLRLFICCTAIPVPAAPSIPLFSPQTIIAGMTAVATIATMTTIITIATIFLTFLLLKSIFYPSFRYTIFYTFYCLFATITIRKFRSLCHKWKLYCTRVIIQWIPFSIIKKHRFPKNRKCFQMSHFSQLVFIILLIII